LRDSLADLSMATPEKLIAMRYAKFRAMGVFSE
jgi:acetyl-CoA carboxylase alpha subunit